MASVVFTLVDSKNGINNVSFDIEDADMERLYTAFRHLYTPPMGPDDDPRPPIAPKEIAQHLAWAFMKNIITNVHDLEQQMAIEKLNIQHIQVKD